MRPHDVVYNAAMTERLASKINGVLDDSFDRVAAEETETLLAAAGRTGA